MRTGVVTAAMLIFPLLSAGCGTNEGAADDAVDVAKLVGTPFEGMTSGNDIGWCQLQEGSFLTTTVPSFPIPVFLAFFSAGEEEMVAEGIQMANDAAGIQLFTIVDEWSPEDRVIYKVDEIYDSEKSGYLGEDFFGDTGAKTVTIDCDFAGKNFSDLVVTDWQIEISDNPFSSYVELTAHELGHALGIRSHSLIDYDNDTLLPLEDNSIMGAYGGYKLTDYTFMMQKQAELYQRHVGEEIRNPGGICYDRVPVVSE